MKALLYLQCLLVLFLVSGTAPLSAENRVGEFFCNALKSSLESQPQAVESQRDTAAFEQETVLGATIATGEHPFWTVNRGWVFAHELQPGDKLLEPDGKEPTVVSAVESPTLCSTYNLTIEGTHTFFVMDGKTPVLVHNVTTPNAAMKALAQLNGPGGPSKGAKLPGQFTTYKGQPNNANYVADSAARGAAAKAALQKEIADRLAQQAKGCGK